MTPKRLGQVRLYHPILGYCENNDGKLPRIHLTRERQDIVERTVVDLKAGFANLIEWQGFRLEDLSIRLFVDTPCYGLGPVP